VSTLTIVLKSAYEVFNAGDAAAIGPFIHPDATWPNTLETGEPLVGRDAVIDHFRRLLTTLRPNIHLIAVIDESADALTVDAQYAVETPDGQIWSDTRARLIYHFQDGLISGMTILSGF
jgi:ketosteroid isomerase-like protein